MITSSCAIFKKVLVCNVPVFLFKGIQMCVQTTLVLKSSNAFDSLIKNYAIDDCAEYLRYWSKFDFELAGTTTCEGISFIGVICVLYRGTCDNMTE